MHVTLIYRGSGLVWGSLGRAKPVGPSSSRASNCDSSTTTNVLFNAPTTNMSALRILVPVKRVIDYAVRIPVLSGFLTANSIPWITLRKIKKIVLTNPNTTGQTPRQQSPDSHRDQWRQTQHEPFRRTLNRRICTNS